MKLLARKVLEDCRVAHGMMELEIDPVRLRVQWIGALALIRLVGDVLHKIDSKSLPYLKTDIKSHWNEIKNSDEPIFWKFIKGARDRAVHEYEIDLYDKSEVFIAVMRPDGIVHNDRLDACMFMPLQGGYGAGEDARDIYLKAICWWDHQLSQFEGLS